MELHYLLFDASDESSGAGSFDAMASVTTAHRNALLAEVRAVLQWAQGAFGHAVAGDQGLWDFDLQASDAAGRPLPVEFDGQNVVLQAPPDHDGGRLQLTVTLSGQQAFCDAFEQAFSQAA